METVYYQFDVENGEVFDVEEASVFETERDIYSHDGNGYDEWEVEWLVEEICKYHFHNRDGWEYSDYWSSGITIALWDSNRTLIGLYETVLEYEPTFSAYKIKK